MEPIAGRYEPREQLGESTWRATDTELGRDVVVRLGPRGALGAAPLTHPNIASVFDHGETDGAHFEVREHLPGGSLDQRGAASLSEADAHAVAADVAAALAFAHARGVAHGSLTEANVLFDPEGRAKVSDFAGAGDPEGDVRALGAILGSLAAAAPALGAFAAAASAGEADAATLAARLDEARPAPPPPPPREPEPVTMVVPPPTAAAAPPRRSLALALVAGAVLLAAGVAAAFLATARTSGADDPRDAPSVTAPATSASTADETGETDAPEETEAPPTTESTTTQRTTTQRTTTAPTTTAPPPTTTEPPPTTTEPPPPTETEEPPPTETEEPPPPTDTAPATTGATTTTG